MSCEEDLISPLESLYRNRGSSLVEAENSVFLSSCHGDLGVSLELQEGSQALSHVEAWTSTFLSSGKRGVSPPVELRWEIRACFSHATGESDLPSCFEEETRGPIQVAAGESGLMSS